MGMNYGDVFASGVLGAFMGAGKAVESNAQEEIKRESERIREERLSKLRMGEYQQQLNMKTDQEAKDRARMGAAAQAIDTKVAGMEGTQQGTEVDESGQPIGVIEGARKLSDREKAAARIKEAQGAGEKDLVTQYEKQHSDLISEQRADRQDAREEQRTRNEEARNALADAERQRREKADQSRDATANRKLDAMIAGLIGKNGKSDLAERKFSEKQWSDAKKDLTSSFFNTDEVTGKDLPDHTARAAASSAMRTIQAANPGVDPQDAAAAVGQIVSQVAAAAKAEAKGDATKYQKFMNAGVQMKLDQALGGKPQPAPKSAPASGSAPSPAPTGPDVPTTPARTGFRAASDEHLRKLLDGGTLTPELSAEVKDEMRRRGILNDDALPGAGRFEPA